MKELKKIIESQQKGHEESPIWMIGEQLKEIAEREPVCVEILKRDLQVEGMGLKDAEKALKAHADEQKRSGNCVVISPLIAEKIFREFYGLPDRVNGEKPFSSVSADIVDLESFL